MGSPCAVENGICSELRVQSANVPRGLFNRQLRQCWRLAWPQDRVVKLHSTTGKSHGPAHFGSGGSVSFVASVHADALNLLRAGLAARVRGDFNTAIAYYTQAIDTGELTQAQRAVVLNAVRRS
jgi:hypothetical protein